MPYSIGHAAALATAGVITVASLGFAGYESTRASELAGIAATAQLNASETQRQYLASLDYRISRLEEGAQGDGPSNEDADPQYQKNMLQAQAVAMRRHASPSAAHGALRKLALDGAQRLGAR
jgi:hypothetical protein